MVLPRLPKELRSLDAYGKPEALRRIDEWARGTQQLAAALRDGNPSILTRLDELEASVAAIGGGGGVTDHGALTGLGDDDHGQYLRTDGTRALTGDQSAGSHKITDLAAPTNPNDAARLTDIPSGVGFGAVSGLTAGGANANGTAGTAARSDHVHAAPVGAPVALTAGGTQATGTSSNFAAADHKHATAVGAPSTLVVGGSNTTGTSSDFAARDHIHALPAFGTTAGTFAEGNHTHSGLGSGYVDLWNDLLPPTSPHSCDDECDGNSLAGKWSTFDPDTTDFAVTAVPTRKYYRLDKSTGSGMAGIYQNVPASEFSVVCRLHLNVPPASTLSMCGLFVAQGAASTNDMHGVCNRRASTTVATSVARFTSNDIAGATYTAAANNQWQQAYRWLKLRVNGTTVAAEVSEDGEHWFQIDSATAAFTPSIFGVALLTDTGISCQAIMRNFRVVSGAGSSAWDALLPGRLSRVSYP